MPVSCHLPMNYMAGAALKDRFFFSGSLEFFNSWTFHSVYAYLKVCRHPIQPKKVCIHLHVDQTVIPSSKILITCALFVLCGIDLWYWFYHSKPIPVTGLGPLHQSPQFTMSGCVIAIIPVYQPRPTGSHAVQHYLFGTDNCQLQQ